MQKYKTQVITSDSKVSSLLGRIQTNVPKDLKEKGLSENLDKWYSIEVYFAAVAQLVERPTCNRMVEGSIPFGGTLSGEVA